MSHSRPHGTEHIVSDAQVAETDYVAFTGRRTAEHVARVLVALACPLTWAVSGFPSAHAEAGHHRNRPANHHGQRLGLLSGRQLRQEPRCWPPHADLPGFLALPNMLTPVGDEGGPPSGGPSAAGLAAASLNRYRQQPGPGPAQRCRATLRSRVLVHKGRWPDHSTHADLDDLRAPQD